jgi:hypothetical protein
LFVRADIDPVTSMHLVRAVAKGGDAPSRMGLTFGLAGRQMVISESWLSSPPRRRLHEIGLPNALTPSPFITAAPSMDAGSIAAEDDHDVERTGDRWPSLYATLTALAAGYTRS